MTDSEQARRERNEATVRGLLAKFSSRSEEFPEVCDDLRFELPYGPPQFCIEGIQPWLESLRAMYAVVKDFVEEPVEFHHMLDPDEVVLEWRSKGKVLPTGKTYENRYIGVFRFTEDGRVKFYREYHNPNKTREAFPPEWSSPPEQPPTPS